MLSVAVLTPAARGHRREDRAADRTLRSASIDRRPIDVGVLVCHPHRRFRRRLVGG